MVSHVRTGRSGGTGLHEGATTRAAGIVGREAELTALREFFAAPAPAALVLVGGPGFGKTTLWEAGIEAARERGIRVLSMRASGAEAQLSFAGLIDLLDGVSADELAELPGPQLHALEVALLRTEPTGAPTEPQAIALGFLAALRSLAARGPLVMAVDDVPWLDRPSADALAFAARRLEGHDVRFLLAKRPGGATGLEASLAAGAPERLEVGPLSLGATRRLLSERLGLSLSRHVLRRIVDSTLGNPLFALELGRTLADRGPLEPGEDIPVPDAVEDLLGTRVEQLARPVRRVLAAVALSGELHTAELAGVADQDALDDALDGGVIAVDGDRVRASHPLLAAVATKRLRSRERRDLHLELARAVGDEQLQALHLALATQRADSGLAASLAAAAAVASARGARQEAAELAEHALRLTPKSSPERSDRLVALAGYLDMAGQLQRVTELLTPELDSLPPGASRVRAWLLLAEGGGVRTLHDLERHLDVALAECGDDPGLRANVLVRKADHAAASAVTRIREAEAWALEALPAARRAGADVERLALLALSWARSLSGRPIDDLCARHRAASGVPSTLSESPDRIAGQRLVWRGELDGARATFVRLLALADERGELLSYALQRLHLCELELRAGEWQPAERLLDEWAESTEGDLLIWPMYERCRALLAAGRGLPAEADRWAADALAHSEASGGGWDVLEARRAAGIAALLAHEPARAAESLRAVWEHTCREGVDEPGVFPVAPELVDALVELVDLDGARSITDRLAGLAEEQEHPWGLASAQRCRAMLQLAGDDDDAAAALEEAAAAYERLGLRFDAARTLLALGRAQRRRKKWAAARTALEQAAAAFDEIGSPGWVDAARAELARIGGRRRSAPGELTATERRVVELAADGLSNKEIARALYVTVHTVEVHLSHAYAKLGVRSRAQLAGRLARSKV